MSPGSKIFAPEGFKCLKVGVIYHFLISDGARSRVHLVEFVYQNQRPEARLITLRQFEFEEALENGWLVEDGVPASLPPWLEPIEGKPIWYLEQKRVSKKKSYESYVNHRFEMISDLFLRREKVLAEDNPDAAINIEAKKLKQAPARLRAWFYTYLMYGQNRWTLIPSFQNNGRYVRDAPERKIKLGRPSSQGKRFGYPCNKEMKEKIKNGFNRYADPSLTQAKIYSKVLKKEFGCKSKKIGAKQYEFTHPNGEPFPSFDQFMYWAKKQVSPKQLNVALKGEHGTRAISGSMGTFDEKILNVYQRVEFDGYYFNEKLQGLTEGSAVDGYCVVRARCVGSGYILGIGFSEGRENMAAYMATLFCMAVGKVKYCELFGLTITADEWVSEGLCSGIVLDRGPAAMFECGPKVNWLNSVELTPTFSGQSKATIESSHPKKKKIKGQPTHHHSDHNFVQMAKREILRAVKDNHSLGKVNLEDELVLAGVAPTPHGVFGYWAELGRSSAITINFDTAVRTFLVSHPVTIRKDAVYLYGRKYRSKELVDTGLFDSVARHGVVETEAYVLTMCVRHIWIDVKGHLYQLDVIRTVRSAAGLEDITLKELQQIDKMRQEGYSDHRRQAAARDQYYMDRHEEAVGLEWHGGQKKSRAAPKGAAYKQDMNDYRTVMGTKK
ncbi:transposase [Pseudomonas sp. URMO17WK12:I11]|uniref:transposase n=1 Tax=Pseudomonas sp. URMO17WK12:I11 TaxID=1283291 RepID=UPI0018D7CFCB|nr:transposase [Pseudomonas sp. URMO17WK12:I11]MBH3362216.1 transposase [Pseudomonas sp. URMO17WK12:I11]